MGYFNDAGEIDKYIGGTFRKAAEHPEVGGKLRAAGVVLKIVYTDPDCEMTVAFQDPMTVDMGDGPRDPDITLTMDADTADKYWRGEYNLAVGLAKGQVKAEGPVNKILKMVPLTKPLFPLYRERVAEKDATAS